jgi:hypothetical protein
MLFLLIQLLPVTMSWYAMWKLTNVLPMLEVVQSLNKLVQSIDGFICDYMIVVKFIQVDLYNLYADLKTHFSHY